MANYHANLFVVAASERDMLNVLRLCARNLLACSDVTHFILQNYEQYESAIALYRQLEGFLADWYDHALSGASGTRAQDAGNPGTQASPGTSAVTWGVNELGRSALNDGAGKIAAYFGEMVGSPNLEVSVSTAPTGRRLSDSADVRLDEYAGSLVLSMAYSTAWEPNSGDVDAFFELLGAGDYGVAFLDADEGDGYSEISAFCGLHHGGCGLKELDSPRTDDFVGVLELKKDAEKYARVDREGIHDFEELAYAVAVCRWPNTSRLNMHPALTSISSVLMLAKRTISRSGTKRTIRKRSILRKSTRRTITGVLAVELLVRWRSTRGCQSLPQGRTG